MREKHRTLRLQISALLATAAIATAICPSAASAKETSAVKQPSAVYKVDTSEKVVALTFDISWGEKVPEPVLDVLEKEKVKQATFFLSGPWTLRHPETAKRIHDMGFEIGSHGNLHKDFSNYPNSWIREQVQLAQKSIYQVTSVKTRLIRTPNGDFNPRVVQCLNDMGYTVIQWNTDSLDWKNPGTGAIVNRVLKRAVPGDIILMHASDSSRQITEALPQIVAGLRQEGYHFATVSELLNQTKVKSEVQ